MLYTIWSQEDMTSIPPPSRQSTDWDKIKRNRQILKFIYLLMSYRLYSMGTLTVLLLNTYLLRFIIV